MIANVWFHAVYLISLSGILYSVVYSFYQGIENGSIYNKWPKLIALISVNVLFFNFIGHAVFSIIMK